MKEFLPPFILILIGIGFYYSSVSEKIIVSRPDKNRVIESSGDAPTGKIPLAMKGLDSKETEDKEIYGDSFPRRYLANWNTDEGPMKLMQGPDMWVRGFYYYDNKEVRGRVTTRYIQKGSRKILSGYWVQDKSDQRCDYSRYGSHYWGRLAFDFQNDKFVGIWGYCDDKTKANWNGKLA